MGKGKDGGLACCAACGAAACCCFIVLIVLGLVGFGLIKIIIGAVHLHDCTIEDRIPIWLIVSGCAPILFGGLRRRNTEDSDDNNLCGTICGTIGFLFNLAWLICGSVWVYPNYRTVTADDFNPCTGNVTTRCTQGDCNETLITFACAMATIDWICMGFWTALICCRYRVCEG